MDTEICNVRMPVKSNKKINKKEKFRKNIFDILTQHKASKISKMYLGQHTTGWKRKHYEVHWHLASMCCAAAMCFVPPFCD